MEKGERPWFRRWLIGCAIWACSPIAITPLAFLLSEIFKQLGVQARMAEFGYLDGCFSGALLMWLLVWYKRPA